jgi:HlyD family secretion protein
MKKLLLLILVLTAGGGVWWWMKDKAAEETTFTTAPVTRGTLTQAVTATGTLNPVVNVTVGSQISGNIQKLNADWNSLVKAGDIVAQLDAATYQAIKDQVEGEVALAEASLELAKLTAQRKRDLVKQNAAPQADLDSAEASLLQAQATLRIRQANLQKAKVDLERCTIRSPIDGIVISRSVDVGQTVAASMNAPELFRIANDLTKMQIDSNVAEADVGSVEEKQAVEFSVDAFPYRTFRGTVAQVRNAATTVQNVVTYNVVVAVDNPDLKLKPGMTANVSIIVAQRDDVLKVPNAALRFRLPEPDAPGGTPAATRPPGGGGGGEGTRRRTGGGPAGGPRAAGARTERKIYVMRSGAAKPEAVSVKLGISDGVATEVTEGLKEGDLVVTGMSAPAKSTPAPNPLGGSGMPRRF